MNVSSFVILNFFRRKIRQIEGKSALQECKQILTNFSLFL